MNKYLTELTLLEYFYFFNSISIHSSKIKMKMNKIGKKRKIYLIYFDSNSKLNIKISFIFYKIN